MIGSHFADRLKRPFRVHAITAIDQSGCRTSTGSTTLLRRARRPAAVLRRAADSTGSPAHRSLRCTRC